MYTYNASKMLVHKVFVKFHPVNHQSSNIVRPRSFPSMPLLENAASTRQLLVNRILKRIRGFASRSPLLRLYLSSNWTRIDGSAEVPVRAGPVLSGLIDHLDGCVHCARPPHSGVGAATPISTVQSSQQQTLSLFSFELLEPVICCISNVKQFSS